jgi:hypothetical protein
VVRNSSVKIKKKTYKYIHIYVVLLLQRREVWINEFKEAKNKVFKEVKGKTTY